MCVCVCSEMSGWSSSEGRGGDDGMGRGKHTLMLVGFVQCFRE